MASAESKAALTEQNAQFQAQMAGMETKLAGLQQAREDLQAQLRESQRGQQETLQQLYDAQTERDRQINALQEAAKVCARHHLWWYTSIAQLVGSSACASHSQ